MYAVETVAAEAGGRTERILREGVVKTSRPSGSAETLFAVAKDLYVISFE